MRAPAPLVAVLLALGAGCGWGNQRIAVTSMAEMDRVRVAPAARDGANLAPLAFARAEQERTLAQQAFDTGDDVAASLHADRAIAAYEHAFVLARLARATNDASDAKTVNDAADAQADKLEATRVALEHDARAPPIPRAKRRASSRPGRSRRRRACCAAPRRSSCRRPLVSPTR